MTMITVYVRPADEAKLDYISLICQGIDYKPMEMSKVNDLYKCVFRIETEPDTTSVLSISVSDSLRIMERLG